MKLSKNMNNLEIAELLTSISAAYKLTGSSGSRFKIVAYERAADAVEHLSSEAKDLWDDGKLEEVAGIGKSIASHLDEIFRTGTSKHFEDLVKDIPPATFDLLKVSGVGPKTAYKIATEYKTDFSKGKPLAILKKLAKKGKIAAMDGFTELTEKSILEAIDEVKTQKDKRLLLNYAQKLATEITDWLKEDENILEADPLGSLRRKASTVGDVDITVSAHDPQKALERFVSYPNANRTIEKGDRSASIIIAGGRRVDMIASRPEAYGALLQHFTGSKHHNVALREFALKHNLSLSDYGIYKIDKKGNKKLEEIETEKEFYAKLGMDWIPPELREDRGEIEAALKHILPTLVEIEDIKGDLHMHSDFDIETSHDIGANSMMEHIDVASKMGYEYIAFTEHNPSKSKHTDQEILDLIKKKKEKIEHINLELGNRKNGVKKVFNSLEIDMLPKGGVPVSNNGLDLLDFALVSIHSSFRLSRKHMTERVLKSLEHPKAKIFAHPTGRILNEREGVELDWEAIFSFCVEKDKWIEINASPSRLDLPDSLVRDAVKNGVKLSLGTDAHHIDHMSLMPYGVSVARRGWCEKKDIVNTRTLSEFENMLK